MDSGVIIIAAIFGALMGIVGNLIGTYILKHRN